MFLAYPYGFDRGGRTAAAEDLRHVRDLIEQVLFTVPGERVMRPELGSGIAQLVFAPSSPELAAATQMLVQGALQRWLGEIIIPTAVEVETDNATLRVTVEFQLRRDGRTATEVFTRAGGGAP